MPSPPQNQPTPRSVPPAQTPIAVDATKIRKPFAVAGGLRALREVAAYALRHTGAKRTLRTVRTINQKNGFDCQSCAWPNPDGERSVAEFCENGFKAVAYEATTKRADAEFFRRHSIAELGAQSDHWLGDQGRLTEPMVLRPGGTHYEPIGWTEAFASVASELKALGSPHEAVFYTSGRTSNEAAFLYQLFVRAFGTNNLPDCSNMCHESTSVALPPMLGIGKGCVRLGDFEKADAIFLFGQNPGTNHPRMLTALQAAKAHGCTIVSVNPLPETGTERFKNPQDLLHPTRLPRFFLTGGTPLSDLWLPVLINGDLAFLHGLMKEMLDEEDRRPGQVFDHAFIRHYTAGFDALVAQLRDSPWDRITADSGLSREQIRAAAEIAMRSRRIIACWCMGVTQHHNAVATIQQIVNFLLLGGNIGRPGAGPCPVRGHSNVQGDRTMGIWERPRPEFLDRLAAEFGFEPPREPGLDTVHAVRAMNEGRARVFFAMGGNFLSATSDTEFTASGLRQCRLTAHVSTKLNRSHVVTGRTALILPCLGRTEVDRQAGGEQFVTVEDSMGVINSSRGNLAPASDRLLSEPALVAGLAKAVLGPAYPIDWDAHVADYGRIRERIEAVVPGFAAYNERIREGPFYLPNAPRDERRFATPSGKAVFQPAPLSRAPVEPGMLLLTTIRSHDQFNTSIYGLDDRYRGIYNGRRVIFLNPDDIEAAGLVQGQLVDITSHFKGRQRRAEQFMVAPYAIPRRCAAAYFPEANVLVPNDSIAEGSHCPASKSIPITLARSAEQRPGRGV